MVRNYRLMTKSQALDWLQRNDSEFNWAGLKSCAEGLRKAVGDNLQDFGVEVQADGLKARFPLRGKHRGA